MHTNDHDAVGTTYWLLLWFIFCQEIDGEVVPEAVVRQYASYYRASRVCPANSEVCHLCTFEARKSNNCIVPAKNVRHPPVHRFSSAHFLPLNWSSFWFHSIDAQALLVRSWWVGGCLVPQGWMRDEGSLCPWPGSPHPLLPYSLFWLVARVCLTIGTVFSFLKSTFCFWCEKNVKTSHVVAFL
jgi:hypothetical protein